jgi:hypothetical protein
MFLAYGAAATRRPGPRIPEACDMPARRGDQYYYDQQYWVGAQRPAGRPSPWGWCFVDQVEQVRTAARAGPDNYVLFGHCGRDLQFNTRLPISSICVTPSSRMMASVRPQLHAERVSCQMGRPIAGRDQGVDGETEDPRYVG